MLDKINQAIFNKLNLVNPINAFILNKDKKIIIILIKNIKSQAYTKIINI